MDHQPSTLNHQPTGGHEALLGAAELAQRFPGLTVRAAQAWLRELPHMRRGRRRWTTESWLASWMAANVKNPPRTKCFDPLEAAVADRAAWAVGELVRQGKVRVSESVSERVSESVKEVAA